MKIGITYDLREDYGIDRHSLVFADFCHPDEIDYMARGIAANGYEPVMIGNMYKLNEQIKNGTFDCDYVLVCDEGLKSRNREAIVPALLELNRIRYIGSDAYAMGLSQNKYHTNIIASSLGVRCPRDLYLEYDSGYAEKKEEILQNLENSMKAMKLEFPAVVKPVWEGYSMGVFKVEDMEQLWDAAVFNFENYREPVLIEEYIRGKEVYAPILGNGEEAYVLNIGTCRRADGSDIDIFSLEDKCFTELTDEVAELEYGLKTEIVRQSLLLYRHLGCADFGRCDFKITEEGIPYFLEINPRPGLTENGPYETCGKSAGMTYAEIIGEVIGNARKRYGI